MDSDTEIFNDDQSKLEMVKRIFLNKMVPLLGIFLLCVIPLTVNFTKGEFNDPGYVGFAICWSILFALYLAIFLKCGIGIYRLRKIIHIEWISLGVIEEEYVFNPDLPKEVF